MIKKPEPMFGIFPKTITGHGLSRLIADQFNIWREVAPKLTPELRRQISESYYQDKTPFPLDPGPPIAQTIFEAKRTEQGHEIQPFCVMTRGKEDAEWRTVQEYGAILPRQHAGSGMRLRLENPFGRQAPQFIIRVLNGYTDGSAERGPEPPGGGLSKDMQGYLIGAGAKAEQPAHGSEGSPASVPPQGAPALVLQPTAAQITNSGKHQFADVGPALEVVLDNRLKQGIPAGPGAGEAEPEPATEAAPPPVEHFQTEGFPSFPFRGNAQTARGLALTVTGDGSGALLIVQVGQHKDYVVPVDFTGRRDVFIPLGEVARTTGRWGMRYHSRGAGYGPFNSVSIGFARVPVNSCAKALVENLRMVGDKPSLVKNPVVHAGSGSLSIQGEVKTDRYLWYQGGATVGVYDLDWRLLETLPVVLQDYAVNNGFADFWIEGESASPPPWFDVQFIARGEVLPLNN